MVGLQVSFRGKPLALDGVGGETPVSVLKEKLAGLTAVPVTNQKLVSAVSVMCPTPLQLPVQQCHTRKG